MRPSHGEGGSRQSTPKVRDTTTHYVEWSATTHFQCLCQIFALIFVGIAGDRPFYASVALGRVFK